MGGGSTITKLVALWVVRPSERGKKRTFSDARCEVVGGPPTTRCVGLWCIRWRAKTTCGGFGESSIVVVLTRGWFANALKGRLAKTGFFVCEDRWVERESFVLIGWRLLLNVVAAQRQTASRVRGSIDAQADRSFGTQNFDTHVPWLAFLVA